MSNGFSSSLIHNIRYCQHMNLYQTAVDRSICMSYMLTDLVITTPVSTVQDTRVVFSTRFLSRMKDFNRAE
ncbi:hypothetical protein BN903_2 [Halorubrum sp. AJ67]|nr:hypothetical protein BN903_2 [Halorubrum sp. AJ67]